MSILNKNLSKTKNVSLCEVSSEQKYQEEIKKLKNKIDDLTMKLERKENDLCLFIRVWR